MFSLRFVKVFALLCALGIALGSATSALAVACECYNNGVSCNPRTCCQDQIVSSKTGNYCKQFCSDECDPADPNHQPHPLYNSGCCSYYQQTTAYGYTPIPGCPPGSCNTTDCVRITNATHWPTLQCKRTSGSDALCLEVINAGSDTSPCK